MYALRMGTRRFVQASQIMHQASPNTVALISRRNHVYDKRNYVPEIDDYTAYPTARPWDHFTLRANQNRQRRFGQYFLWICSVYVFWAWFRYMVHRQRLNKVEKWDYQTKYWRYISIYFFFILFFYFFHFMCDFANQYILYIEMDIGFVNFQKV